MRHSATRALLERRDVVIVASVSCIYVIGAVETYSEMTVNVKAGQRLDAQPFMRRLVELQYRRNERSEEHTSELQSLMRISYAVFCLKQKKNTPSHHGRRHIYE